MSTRHPPRRWRRRPLPPTAKSEVPTVSTIHALGDELLLEIFLRLPSLPSLVRAALTCRAFLAVVRSSPDFRRRFRSLHPPPLLGFFFESIGNDIASFSPIRRRSDPDTAAAVRGADVCLTRLPYNEDASPGWTLQDSRGGYLLLLNCSTEQVAVYNPLTRALDLLPIPPDETSNGCRGEFSCMGFFLLYPNEGLQSSFRVVAFCHDKSRLRASVFSSSTSEWQFHPWTGTAPAQPSAKRYWLNLGTQATGNLYLAHSEEAYMVVLDTTTLQFSFIDLPEHLKGQDYLYMTGENKDGKLCIVSIVEFSLHTWFRRADASGVEKWTLHNVIPLERDILQATESPEGVLRLKVCAVLKGIVYMWTIKLGEPRFPSWFLSFCLETGRLEKLFHRTFDNSVYPYFMAWPSLLVGKDLTWEVFGEIWN